MIRTLAALTLISLFSPVLAPAQEPALKAGWVDMEAVFKGYSRAQEILGEDSPLMREKQRKEKELSRAQEELLQTQKDLEARALLLNPEAMKKQQDDLVRRQLALRRQLQEAETELQGRVMEISREISGEISARVAELARREGYAYILRSEALLYQDPSLDLTARVLEELNRGRPAAPAAD